MYGRYGTDELNLVFDDPGIIVMFLSRIFWFCGPRNYFLRALHLCAVPYVLAQHPCAAKRMIILSLKVWTPVQKWFRIKKTAFRERKQYKYFRCPGCRQQLSAPRGRGKILCHLPGCHKQFKQKT